MADRLSNASRLRVSLGLGAMSVLTFAPLANADPAPAEITVRGTSTAARMRQSSEAVQVVETEEAKRSAADLGEVLARREGVSVRREGGLGSGARLSLNGLTDDQIRFFVDGLPLDLSGFGLGVANVPVNLLSRVEIYRGVVPVRFGADALGGALNLVTRQDLRGTHGGASYEIGSYRTHRLALSGQHLDAASGVFGRVALFADSTRNDYPVDVEVPDAEGRPSHARVRRFHDAYRAYGAHFETGFVQKPWADRLLLRAFVTDYTKELQNNIVMTVPYGEPTYGERAYGATIRYEESVATGTRASAIVGYSRRAIDFVDVGTSVYDWFGRRVRARPRPGEINGEATDQTTRQDSVFARLNLAWTEDNHALRLAVAPTYATRRGEDRTTLPGARDPLTAERALFTMVTGAEYKIDGFDRALENIFFAKDYIYAARAEEYLPRDVTARRDTSRHRFGVGDGVRLRLLPSLYAKASYEYATRLPRPDEVFGDGIRVAKNLDLLPEASHNTNVGIVYEAPPTEPSAPRIEITGFDRRASNLVVLLGNGDFFVYDNVHDARSTGFEAAARWSLPSDIVTLDGNVTWQSFRNVSSEGAFAAYDGDRIPNRPYFFANGSMRFALHDISSPRDEISVTWVTRYVHEFFRGWEHLGLRDYKQVIPSQIAHSAAVTYLVRSGGVAVSSTLEMQNVTDTKTYDYFGVERPGRSVYFKGALEF